MILYNLLTKLSDDTFICIERIEEGLKFITPPILNDSLLINQISFLLYQEIEYIYPKMVDEIPVVVIRI